MQDQQTYEEWYQNIANEYDRAKKEYTKLETEINQRQLKCRNFRLFQEGLAKQKDILLTFDKALWAVMVESVTIYHDDSCKVAFKNGQEILLPEY